MVDETNNDDAIKIGHMYSVKRLDGEYCPAEVLETRTLKSNQTEYFVHFENSRPFFVYFLFLAIVTVDIYIYISFLKWIKD